MYKLRITNLANFSREIQFYQLNKYVVLAPKRSVDLCCNSQAGLAYYQNLQRKQFKVSVLSSPVEDKPAQPVNQAPVVKTEAVPVIKEEKAEPEVKPVEEIKEEAVKEPAENSVVEDVKLEDLTDRQLKDIVAKLGVSTSMRARWKLIDLINLNLPDGAKLSEYLS